VVRQKWIGVPKSEDLEKAVQTAVEEAIKTKG
jgi:hypothetical protein